MKMKKISEVEQDFFEKVFNGIPDPIFIQLPDHTVIFCNSACHEFLGIEEANGKKCFELMGRGNLCPGCVTEKSLNNKKVERAQIYSPELDKYIDCRSSPILDDDGNVLRVLEHLRDVTCEKLAEQVLLEDSKRFKEAAEASGDFIWELDSRFHHVYVSDSISEVAKMPKEKILGRTPFEFMVPEDAERVKNLIRDCIGEGRRKQTVEARFFRPDGSEVWLEIKAAIFFDEKGGIAGFRGVSKDITEHKEDEEALRLKKERYQLAINSEEDLLCCSRPDTTIIYVNPAYARSCGKEYKDLIGRKFLELASPEEQVSILEHLRTLSKDNPRATRENEMLLPDGGIAWHEWTNHAVFSDDGELIEYLSIGVDITKRKLMEKQLTEYTSKIQEQELSLEQKKSALKELIEYVETAKAEAREEIAANIKEFVLPALDKLRTRGESSKYIDIIHDFLTKELTSAFGRKITGTNNNLTPKEIQICGMFREGLSTKEAANLLNVSYRTLEKHRQNIRRKLNLSNEHVNLTSYLRNI